MGIPPAWLSLTLGSHWECCRGILRVLSAGSSPRCTAATMHAVAAVVSSTEDE